MKFIKTTFIFLLLIQVLACSKSKGHGSHGSPVSPTETEASGSTPVVDLVPGTESLGPETEEAISIYDTENLEKLGIHFLGQSNLSNLGNPPVIYCTNSDFQNVEKIEALQLFMEFIQQNNIENISLNEMKIDKTTFILMIQRSILKLEEAPYSRLCPQIFLSI